MKEIKRRMETFSFYDRTGTERHLEEMAEQGWRLEKIGPFFWTYRKIEPQRLAFSVCCFPKASQFDPEPSEEQQTFYDFCEHSGWVLAASNAQLQVFCNERENPVPIETDPVLEVESIHQTMKRSLIPSQLGLLAVAVLNAALVVWRLSGDPIGVLANPANLFTSLCWVIIVSLVGVELGSYFRWHRKAVLAAERGEFLETGSHRKLQIGALVLLAAGTAWFILSIALSGSRLMTAMALVLLFVYAPLLLFLGWGIKKLLRRKKVPARTSMAVTIIAALVTAFAFLGLMTFGIIFGHGQGWWREDGGQSRAPLTVEDLLDPGYDGYDLHCAREETLLLGRIYVQQDPPISLAKEDLARYQELPSINYTWVQVRAPFLYGLCLDSLRYGKDDREEGQVPEGHKRYYESADPAPWGADRAFRWIIQDIGPRDIYLLCYPDRILEVGFSWAPTPEQMRIVGETLGRGEF